MRGPHELSQFLEQVSVEMLSEYQRIYRRSASDPGTAGDEGEANWATLLSEWLPADLHVTTKGRILATDGTLSPQLDLIVLSNDYPLRLRDKKVYLAGGVVAAFECKNTLRKHHLERVFSTAVAISNLERNGSENLYQDSFPPIIYGLLAHSHNFGGDKRVAASKVDAEIRRLHDLTRHPLEVPTVFCVSDLHTWRHHRTLRGADLEPSASDARDGLARSVSAIARWIDLGIQPDNLPRDLFDKFLVRPNPIAELLVYLLDHLALQDSRKARFASYFHDITPPSLLGMISSREWPIDQVHSASMVRQLQSDEWWETRGLDPANFWDPL